MHKSLNKWRHPLFYSDHNGLGPQSSDKTMKYGSTYLLVGDKPKSTKKVRSKSKANFSGMKPSTASERMAAHNEAVTALEAKWTDTRGLKKKLKEFQEEQERRHEAFMTQLTSEFKKSAVIIDGKTTFVDNSSIE